MFPIIKEDRVDILSPNRVLDTEAYRNYLWDLMATTIDNLNNYSQKILQMSDLRSYFASRDSYSKARSDFFAELYRNADGFDVKLAAERIIINDIKQAHKDVF